MLLNVAFTISVWNVCCLLSQSIYNANTEDLNVCSMMADNCDTLRKNKNNLFKCLLLANFLQYLEAGAVPALLLQLSESFHMGPAKQGLLGGVVYLSLSLGGPFAGYLLRRFEHKTVISCAVAANMTFTLIWALTPVGHTYSTNMFIAVRFLMGLCQCVICVFLPLWTNENAPKETRTSWMSYLQASVPFGVMTGYIIASILTSIAQRHHVCWGLLCWRWSFIIEVMLLTPLYMGLYFIPKKDLAVCANSHTEQSSRKAAKASPQDHSSSTTAPMSEHNSDGFERTIMLERHRSSSSAVKQVPVDTTSGDDSNVPAIGNPFLVDSPPQDKTGSARHTQIRSGGGKSFNHSPSHSKRAHLTPEERKQYSSLRQTAMSASMFDSMSTRHAFKKSTDNIALLGSKDDPFPVVPGLRWKDAEPCDNNFSSHTAHKNSSKANHGTSTYANLEEGRATREEEAQRPEDVHGPFFAGGSLIEESGYEDEGLGNIGNNKVSKSAGAKSTSRSSLNVGEARHASTTSKRTGKQHPSSHRAHRRQSLHEWLLGSIPPLPFSAKPSSTAATSTAADGAGTAEESTYLLAGRVKSNKSDNTRRSLDNSFRHIELLKGGSKPKNRRNSTSMVASLPHNVKEIKAAKKAKTPEPFQYESFKDISKKSSDFGSTGRPSWGVFSMLGYNRSRSNSGTGTGGDFSFIARATQSDKIDGYRSPNPLTQAVTPGGTQARRYSASDLDLDFTLFDEIESPGPAISPVRTRSRTCSNPTRVSESLLLSSNGVPSAAGLPEIQYYDDAGDCNDEENQLEEDVDVESCDDDDASLSYDDMSYTESGSESEEEEWPGLSPVPPFEEDSNYGTPMAAARRRSGADISAGSSRKTTPARTLAGAEDGSAAQDESVFAQISRTLGRYYRYGQAIVASVNALLAIKTYRYLLGAMSALYFTVTGVQFWGTKYLSVALHSPLPLVNTLFILCAATGPTLGVFFGGYIVDLSGGYKGAHQRVVALELCSTFGVLGCLFSLPITLLSNIFAVVGFLWVVLFCGGAMLPACSGIVVSIIPRAYRPLSSALALMVFNMFGYFMSLLLSGFLMQMLDAHKDVCDEVCSMTWGFRLVLFWSFISLAFLLSALSASYQHLKDRDRGHSLRRRRSAQHN